MGKHQFAKDPMTFSNSIYISSRNSETRLGRLMNSEQNHIDVGHSLLIRTMLSRLCYRMFIRIHDERVLTEGGDTRS